MGELSESPQVHEARTVTYDGVETLSGILLWAGKCVGRLPLGGPTKMWKGWY